MGFKVSLACLATAWVLGGCATVGDPVSADYTGPTANVSDSVFSESWSKGRYFALVAVDGKSIKAADRATRMASSGNGFAVVLVDHSRTVPARKLNVTLRASHITAAPIHELASRATGSFWEVEGETTFTPVAGASYTVRGVLDPKQSEVWIEDDQTKQKVAHVRQAK